MKIFINGTYQIKKGEEKWKLPESVCSYLDELMANEDEFLVDDKSGVSLLVQDYLNYAKYKKVTVCIAGSGQRYTKNAGKWPEKHYLVHGESHYIYSIERDFGMAEEADCGFSIWDGNDFKTFANMIYLCSQGKRSKLYLIGEDKWIDVNSIEDLKDLRGPDESLDADDIFKVLRQCGISSSMLNRHVDEKLLTMHKLVDCICEAAVPIKDKKRLLDYLAGKQNLKYKVFDAVCACMEREDGNKKIKKEIRKIADHKAFDEGDEIWQEISRRIKEITEAIRAIFPPSDPKPRFVFGGKLIYYDEEGGYIDGFAHCYKRLYLFSFREEEDMRQSKASPEGFFTDPVMVEYYIRNKAKNSDTAPVFYRLEAWNYDDPERSKPRYNYYCDSNGRICWYEKLFPQKNDKDGNINYLPENECFLLRK